MSLPYIGPEEPQKIEVPTELFAANWLAVYIYLTRHAIGGVMRPYIGEPEPPRFVDRPVGYGAFLNNDQIDKQEPKEPEVPSESKKQSWFERHVNFERHEVGGEIHRELEQIGWQLDIWSFGCEYIRNRSGVTVGVHVMVGNRRYRVDLNLSRQRVYSDREMDEGAWVKEECGPWPKTPER